MENMFKAGTNYLKSKRFNLDNVLADNLFVIVNRIPKNWSHSVPILKTVTRISDP